MKSLKWLGVVSVGWALALFACANGSTVAEDEQEVVTPATADASAEDTFRPSLRDGATTTPTDSSTSADASKPDVTTTPDTSTGVDSSVPPTDSGTGVADCDTGNPFLSAAALVQITNLDFPSCSVGCTTCCWKNPVRFCLR